DDGFEQLDAWSYDGRWVYFSSAARDISASNDIYRVSADGGTPLQVSADRYANEWSAAPAPNGTDMAFVGRGYAQWWRHGRAHIDESVITLMRNHSTGSYEPLTRGGAKEVWPMWGDGGSRSSSKTSRSRRTARRSPSSRAAKSSPPRRPTAATRRASRRRPPRSRSPRGRPTADASRTSPAETARGKSSSTTSPPAP